MIGRKLWILFPPDIIPPGIIVSDDQSEVEAPLSLAEWMLNYYAQAKALYGSRAKDPQHRGKMLEGICEEGEIFYVPSGWWHCKLLFRSRGDGLGSAENALQWSSIWKHP